MGKSLCYEKENSIPHTRAKHNQKRWDAGAKMRLDFVEATFNRTALRPPCHCLPLRGIFYSAKKRLMLYNSPP